MSSMNGEIKQVKDTPEVIWLRRCMPVIHQPEIDVKNGNHLVKIVYKFERCDENNWLTCKLRVIYAGEASYNRFDDHTKNTIATIFYRTFNRKVYKRTADINYLEYRDVDLSPDSDKPWGSLFTTDHAGEQSWSQGDKANVCSWFSLMTHYYLDLPFEYWECDESSFRPNMFLNTSNHMWGEEDNNPHMKKVVWKNYPLQEGNAEDAVAFSRKHIPTKCNLYSYLCCCFARNGGGCCDRIVHQEIERTGDSFYVLHTEHNEKGK